MRFALRNQSKITEVYGTQFTFNLCKTLKNNSTFTELPPDKGYRVIQIGSNEFYVISQRFDVLKLSFKK